MAISRKRWEIPPRLLLITNRKWHMPFQLKWKSLTLDDLEGHWQPVQSALLATAGLLVIKCHPLCWQRQDDHGCHTVAHAWCPLVPQLTDISSPFGQRKNLPRFLKKFDCDVVWAFFVILAYCLFNIVFCSFLPETCTTTQSVNFTPRLQTVRIRKC